MNLKPFVATGLLLAGAALAACAPKTTQPAVEDTPVMIQEDTSTTPEQPIMEDESSTMPSATPGTGTGTTGTPGVGY